MYDTLLFYFIFLFNENCTQRTVRKKKKSTRTCTHDENKIRLWMTKEF